jgi:hypothetical protein
MADWSRRSRDASAAAIPAAAPWRRVFHLLLRVFLKPGAGLVDKVLELVLMDFVRLVESVLELFLLSLGLLLLKISIRIKHSTPVPRLA